jgi:4-hydroxy-tetrahydrodipicolinate synthase
VSLGKLINHVIGNKVEFLVVFGTTGEPVTLTKEEQKSVLAFVIEKAQKSVPIIAGCGGNNTMELLEKLKSGFYNGVDAILSVSPYYNKPSQKGIFEHYKIIAENSPVPVVIYNVPSRTGSNVTYETVIKISKELPNVIGLKEASPSVEQFTYIRKDVPKDFLVISGDDSLIVPHMSIGAVGAISVTANVFPLEYSTMVRLCGENKFEEARKIHFKLIEFTDSLFEEGSPAGVKAALEILGIVKNNVRLPLTTVSEKHYNEIKRLIQVVKS